MDFSPNLPPFNTCARLAITSFRFMLDCVPEPVCQITNGNWSSNLLAKISSQAWAIKSRFSTGNTPKSWLAYAAAFFR